MTVLRRCLPRPWQDQTNPKNNDTDGDGQPDGWEMQVTMHG